MSFTTLVLSGGALKGVSMLGALQRIEEVSKLNTITKYFGTSVGALLCVLLAIGYKPIELFLHFTQMNMSFDPVLSKKDMQLVDYDKFLKTVLEIILYKTKTQQAPSLKDLYDIYGKQIHIITYNYTRSKMEVLTADTFPNMSCIDAIRVSCAIPFVFGRVIWNNELYLDGGIATNFPLNIAVDRGACNIISICIREQTLHTHHDDTLTLFFNVMFAAIEHRTEEIIHTYKNSGVYIELSTGIAFTRLRLSIPEAIDGFVKGYKRAREYI